MLRLRRRRGPLILWIRCHEPTENWTRFFPDDLFFALLFIGAVVVLVRDGRTERLGHADVALVPGNKVNADGSPSRA